MHQLRGRGRTRIGRTTAETATDNNLGDYHDSQLSLQSPKCCMQLLLPFPRLSAESA